NEDVADILALLDSLPYDELDLETPRFRLTLRRTPAGWTQSTQVLSAPARSGEGSGQASRAAGEVGTGEARCAGRAAPPAAGTMSHRSGYSRHDVTSIRLGERTHGTDEANVTSGAVGGGGDIAGDAGGDVGADGGAGADGRADADGGVSADGGADADSGAGGGGGGGGPVGVRGPVPGGVRPAARPAAAALVWGRG